MAGLSAVPPNGGPGRKSLKGVAKSALKRVRSSQPFNYIATGATRRFLKATGLHSELIIKHLHHVGTVRCKLPDGRTLSLWSRADDWVSNQLYWRGWSGYEPETTPLFFRLATRAQVTMDVGAYVGFYTVLAAHANTEARVYAFEPLPTVYERLLRNVALNKSANVQCIAAAVGEEAGEAEFFTTVTTEMPTSSSLSYDFMRSADGLCSKRVPVITLDQFVRENDIARVDLIKVDTESTEPQVLRGMVETLRRDHPFIVCEVLKGRGSEQLVEDILRPLSYRYYLLTPDGPCHRDRIEGHPEWLNYLFTTLGPDEVSRL